MGGIGTVESGISAPPLGPGSADVALVTGPADPWGGRDWPLSRGVDPPVGTVGGAGPSPPDTPDAASALDTRPAPGALPGPLASGVAPVIGSGLVASVVADPLNPEPDPGRPKATPVPVCSLDSTLEPTTPPWAPARGWSPALDRYDVGASEGPAPSPPLATLSPRVGADAPSVTLLKPSVIESRGVSPSRSSLPSVPGGWATSCVARGVARSQSKLNQETRSRTASTTPMAIRARPSRAPAPRLERRLVMVGIDFTDYASVRTLRSEP